MAIQVYEIIYPASVSPYEAKVKLGILEFPFPLTGTLKGVYLRVGAPLAADASSAAIFNVRKNGVQLWTGAQRLEIAAGQQTATKTGLSIAGARGDMLRLDLESIGSAAAFAPITLILDIDDGLNTPLAATHTTAALANGQSENASVALGKSFVLTKIVADRACRVRVYLNSDYRTADAARAVGVDPVGEHGVLLDALLTSGNLTLDLAPVIYGTDGAIVRTGNIAVAVENRSGAASTVQTTFHFLKLEA
jgi:hypothetical protein